MTKTTRRSRFKAQGSRGLPRASSLEPRASQVTYRGSGVDIAAVDGWLRRMAPLIRATHRAEVLPDRGQFAGLFRLAPVLAGGRPHLAAKRLREPVLVASTDGVGTKLNVAQLMEPAGRPPERRRGTGAHEAIGVDAVAMNVNDVLVYGAAPLFFLDYLAVGKVRPALLSALLRGVAKGCRESGAALLGGETAEMPGVYGPGAYDIAGFCVGIVERRRLIDGSQVCAGDRIVGLASSGVHANGFSLIRRVFTAAQLTRLKDQLLTPTRIYVRPVLRALRTIPVHAIAHVTGGGLARRIPSLVSATPTLATRLLPGSWPVPSIFTAIQRAGGIPAREMAATFNMGIGMALVCRPRDERRLMRLLQRAGVPAWSIGVIERRRS